MRNLCEINNVIDVPFAENKLQTLVDIEYIQSLCDTHKFIIDILSS